MDVRIHRAHEIDGRLGLFESDSELAPDATPGFFDQNVYTVRLGQ